MTIFATILFASASFAIPPRDGIADERGALAYVIDDFESAIPTFRVENLRKEASEPSVEIRDGIQYEGLRSAFVSAPMLRNLSAETRFAISWTFPAPCDFSGYGGFAYRIRLLKPVGCVRVLVCEKENWTFWAADTYPDPTRLGEWQRVEVSTRFAWRQGGGRPMDPMRRVTTLKDIAFVRLEVEGLTGEEMAFYLDEVGFIEKVAAAAYDGVIAGFDQWGFDLIHYRSNFPFRVMLHIRGPAQNRDFRARYYTVDYAGKRTNLVHDTVFRAGETNRWTCIHVPSDGPGFGRVIGVVYDGDKPLYRKSKGYTTILGLHDEDRNRNPDSIFGTWVGPSGTLTQIGSKWTRLMLRGHEVEFPDAVNPVNPPYRRSVVRRLPGGSEGILCFSDMPGWLTTQPDDNESQKFPPRDYALYEEYIRHVTEANGAFFKLYETWNEPVPWAGWRGNVDELVRLTEATWKGLHAANPDAKLMGPGGYSFLPAFTEEFFAKGGGRWVDAIVTHAYTPVPPDRHFTEGLRNFKDILRRYGQDKKPLYITEMGYATPSVTEEDMAAYMVRCYLYAWAEGVKVMIWHNLQCWANYTPTFDMMWRDGTPRPAFTAFAVMTRALEGAQLVRRIPMPNPAHVGFALRRRNVRILVLWDSEAARGVKGQPYVLSVPEGSRVVLTEMTGREIPLRPDAAGRVTLHPARDPVYVEFWMEQ